MSDRDPLLRPGIVQRLLTQRGTLRCYGAVGESGKISLTERFWRSVKQEYVEVPFFYCYGSLRGSGPSSNAAGAASTGNVRIKGSVSGRRTTCALLDPRSRREI